MVSQVHDKKKVIIENVPYIIPELSHCLIFELHL